MKASILQVFMTGTARRPTRPFCTVNITVTVREPPEQTGYLSAGNSVKKKLPDMICSFYRICRAGIFQSNVNVWFFLTDKLQNLRIVHPSLSCSHSFQFITFRDEVLDMNHCDIIPEQFQSFRHNFILLLPVIRSQQVYRIQNNLEIR